MSIPLTVIRLAGRSNAGDRYAECYNGHDSWGAAMCEQSFIRTQLAADMCIPYLVELDNGDRVLAPADDDNAIRAGDQLGRTD